MPKIICIDHNSSAPGFNLAAEEYFLHEFEEDVVFLYRNNDAVVVGKHQNAYDECSIKYCNDNGIQIMRRLSGGGTVYHGEGNLNFCFIRTGERTDKLIDFRKHLEPVNAFLHSLNVPSVYSGRNDLLVNGFKVSGNAEHVYARKKRVIHHGTLLFSADLSQLGDAIRPKKHITFESHAVKSVRSQVANISDFLQSPMTFDEFHEAFQHFLVDYFQADIRKLQPDDVAKIEHLVKTKFSTPEWNLHYSPGFRAELSINETQTIAVKVKKGQIIEAHLIEQNKSVEIAGLIGKEYHPDSFRSTGLSNDFSIFF